MTEPWQIHVCPVHGQRTPNTLGDCPVGCCDAVMEVVRVVRDTREDRMSLIERPEPDAPASEWRAYARFLGDECQRQARIGNGAMIQAEALRQQLQGAVEALEQIADPPMGDDYSAPREYAEWLRARARLALARLGGQSTAEEAFEQSSGGETLEEAQARQLRGEHAFSPQPDTAAYRGDSQ